MSRTKSQTSIEYIMTIGMSLAILVPLMAIAYTTYDSYRDQLLIKQTQEVAQVIAQSIEQVFYAGPPSRLVIDITFPTQLVNMSVANTTLIFQVKTQTGLHDVIADAHVQIMGTLPTTIGTHRITLESAGTYVQIT